MARPLDGCNSLPLRGTQAAATPTPCLSAHRPLAHRPRALNLVKFRAAHQVAQRQQQQQQQPPSCWSPEPEMRTGERRRIRAWVRKVCKQARPWPEDEEEEGQEEEEEVVSEAVRAYREEHAVGNGGSEGRLHPASRDAAAADGPGVGKRSEEASARPSREHGKATQAQQPQSMAKADSCTKAPVAPRRDRQRPGKPPRVASNPSQDAASIQAPPAEPGILKPQGQGELGSFVNDVIVDGLGDSCFFCVVVLGYKVGMDLVGALLGWREEHY